MSFNKIIIVGNLGKDPELRYTPQALAVCSFSMATTEKRKKGNEYEKITTWFQIAVWGKSAEAASKYLTKGSQVYIEGRLAVEEWTDRDGGLRHTLKVNCSDMQFIGTKKDDDEPHTDADEGSAIESDAPVAPVAKGKDIPF